LACFVVDAGMIEIRKKRSARPCEAARLQLFLN
jgi:hypothetical protein